MNLFWRRIIAGLEILGGLAGMATTVRNIAYNWGNWPLLTVFVFFLVLFTLYAWAGLGLWRVTRRGRQLSIIFQCLQAVYFKLAFFQFVFMGGYFIGMDILEATFGFRFEFQFPSLNLTIGHTGLTSEWGFNFPAFVFLYILTLPEKSASSQEKARVSEPS